jgi:integrase
MSGDPVSRAAFGLTLADVLTAVGAAVELSTARRQDMASAVRTVARAFGRSPELVPADPALLGRRLAEIAPTAHGISERRWANVRSLLLRALALTRPVLPGRSQQAMLPAWLALHQALPCRGDAHRLSRLLRWLSARGTTPDTATVNDLEAFGAVLRDCSLSKNPKRDWREICWIWNKAARTVGGWPNISLPVAKKRVPYTLPWSAFPPSLKADVDRYLDRIAGRDLLQDLPFRPVRAETVDLRERQLRSFASALVHRGREAATLGSLADLVEVETLKEGLRFFLERNNNQSSFYIQNLACTLQAVAKHHVKADKDALEEIARIVGRLKVPTKGLTRKNRDRLRPFDDPVNVQKLIELPLHLMKEANSGKHGPRRAALLAQLAVAIEILLMAPIRLRNLLALEFGVNLIDAGGTLHIVFEDYETKNRGVIDMPLPAEAAALIKEYRDRHFVHLAGADERKLFPGSAGGTKSRSTFRTQLGRAILRRTGLQMNPHLFRHARAKIHLDRHPGEYATVSTALGHASMDTTRNFYTGFEVAAAVRHFDEVILKLRHNKKPVPA